MNIDPKQEKRRLIKCYVISLIFIIVGVLAIVGLIIYPSKHLITNICSMFVIVWFTGEQIKDVIQIIMTYKAIEKFERMAAQLGHEEDEDNE